jgi:hypothetical protein
VSSLAGGLLDKFINLLNRDNNYSRKSFTINVPADAYTAFSEGNCIFEMSEILPKNV